VKAARVLTATLAVGAVCTFTPSALGITRSQQAVKAAGQASFQCFVHDCSGRRLLGQLGPYKGVMSYRFRYFGMHNVGIHKFYAHCDQLIRVNQQGTVSQYRFYACG
jgi:hypothetical protein